ncbi:carboxylate--amine ligase [Lagierella sp.]|uniref:carboxylate--amine ligase n=1 Tax=Lagierella sp. TaxID=2849657 RepID=UPI002638A54F|nr:carboxylate--amine ligase [Lagierella sp.]
MTQKFLPIILGTDINSYGVARSFHEAYGIKSIALGMKHLPFTADSSIVEVITFDNFDDNEVFKREMEKFGKERRDENLLLVSCSDGYTSLVTENSDMLKNYYKFNYISKDLQRKLENKKDFYEICEEYDLNYPETYIVSKENKDSFEIPFEYPVAVKANDSIEFLHLKFPGKKKAYKANNENELNQIIQDVYRAGYTGEMILQDFIPGDHSTVGVLNAYVNTKGEVKMMCFGKCLLDECLPEGIGNYNALVTEDNPELYQMVKNFLEMIDYRGFANFDFKYDRRDGKHKVFEINIRQGRSSYYMTAGGCNFVTFLVDDLIDNVDKPLYKHTEEGLWLYVDPFVLKNYCNKDDLPRAKKLLKRGFKFTQWYEKDRNFKRFLNYWRRRLATIKYYPKFQPEREEI